MAAHLTRVLVALVALAEADQTQIVHLVVQEIHHLFLLLKVILVVLVVTHLVIHLVVVEAALVEQEQMLHLELVNKVVWEA